MKKITEKTWFASFSGDPEGQCMAFLDGNILDCRSENLMWVDLDFVKENYPERLDIITEEEIEDIDFDEEDYE